MDETESNAQWFTFIAATKPSSAMSRRGARPILRCATPNWRRDGSGIFGAVRESPDRDFGINRWRGSVVLYQSDRFRPMSGRPTQPGQPWVVYHIQGTPAKLVGVVHNVPDAETAVARASEKYEVPRNERGRLIAQRRH